MPLFFLLGVLNGLVFGLLPGLSGSVGIALMIPLTFGVSAGQSMALFTAALSGQTFAGSISAILLNTPGTAPNAATTFDGYQLARKGRAGFALGISATASAMGSAIGVVVLIALLPVVRALILSFSFPEFTMLAIMGLAAIAAASRGSLIKGLISGGMGVMLSFVGFSPIGGELRYVFGQRNLFSGIDVIAVLIGLFAISEVMRLLERNEPIARVDTSQVSGSQVWEGVRYVFTQPFLLIRSSLLGTGLGIVPAVGGTVASFLAYFQAMHTSGKDNTFGRGDPRGVLAPEAANDGKDAGAALPSLAFGLPGSADWAIILGAMILHGINPGPNLLRETPDIVWIAIIVILAASWLTSLIGLGSARFLVPITRIRPTLLAPIVAVLALVGSFGLERQYVDVIYAVVFGVAGYYMKRYRVPLVPLILGLLLGEDAERAFFHSLSIFDRGPLIFVERPISLILVVITVALVAGSVWSIHRRHAGKERAPIVVAPGEKLLIGLFLALALFGTLVAYSFQEPSTRLFPIVVGWATTGLAGLFMLTAVVEPLRRRLGPYLEEELIDFGQEDVEEELERTGTHLEELEPPEHGHRHERPVDTRRELALVAVFAGFLLLAWLVGLNTMIPVLLLVLMGWFGKERWLTTAITTVAMTVALWLVFQVLFKSEPHWGLLLRNVL